MAVLGFVTHYLADAVPSDASSVWFFVINSSVQWTAMRLSLCYKLTPERAVICGSLMG